MADSAPHDDTSADYKQFETELLLQERDTASVPTEGVDDATVRNFVSELVD